MQMSGRETGCVFTPSKWADFAIEKYGLIEKWIGGSAVLDPAMGNGELLVSMISHALKKGYSIEAIPVQRLYGIEINTMHFQDAMKRLKALCGENFNPDNFRNDDVLFSSVHEKADIIFANPPWVNYSALPDEYKEKIKPEFLKYGLVKSGAALLLGNSQVNLAALIMFSVMERMMNEGGEAVVFIPLSLVFHTGAHRAFTDGKIGQLDFCITEIIDLAETDAFVNVSTRFGLIHVFRDRKVSFPVKYFAYIQDSNEWVKKNINPLFLHDGPWHVAEPGVEAPAIIKIKIPRESKPRQGINACGANQIMFFDKLKHVDNKTVIISNADREIHIESSVVFPMVHRTNFRGSNRSEKKWVILPYHHDGTIFSENDLKNYPMLNEYLFSQKEQLESRRGKFLRAKINKGYYWAMLGVGKYNFWPYKIIWEAYGKHDFSPLIFEGNWQAGQALYSYLSFKNKKTCERVYRQLLKKNIGKILSSMQLGGTMCWAQPGIMSNFFEYGDTNPVKTDSNIKNIDELRQ
jgi:hypothetical protein